jgi:Second Messenger Oligonucleotide or Dinucleotide Synthetase domain
MSVLHKQFIEFNTAIKLPESKVRSLKRSRKQLRKTVRAWFKENKPNELQPKFYSQGSIMMDTAIKPLPEYDADKNLVEKYDLDDGVYFIEIPDKDNRKHIDTLHEWIFKAVDSHTKQDTVRKPTCIRIVFADGHYIDMPAYYKNEAGIELAHRSKGYIPSDPKAFYEWFNNKANGQLRRIVRYLKAWKNYRELENTNLKFPSGFELTILATEHYVEYDNDDKAFEQVLRSIYSTLSQEFSCKRPTTPIDENLFKDYSETRKNNFLTNLNALVSACKSAQDEDNEMKATKILIKHFGTRFPLGKDTSSEAKTASLVAGLTNIPISPKPYCGT